MISQWERRFAYGDRWYLDPWHGDDNYDGKSWGTAKKTWNGILNVTKSGDTIFLKHYLGEDISIPNNRLLRIIGVEGAYITGTDDLNTPIIVCDYGGFWIEGVTLGGFGGYAEHNMVLLEDIQKGQGERDIQVYGGTANADGGWIGNPILGNVEQFPATFYKTTIVEVGTDWVKVQGDISHWLGLSDKINFSGVFFPIYPTFSYTGIVYDPGTNTSTITGISEPFDRLKPNVNDKVALCLVRVNTDTLGFNHYKGEPIVYFKNNFKSLVDFRTFPFPNFGIFMNCGISSKIIPNASEGFTPQLSLIFDNCFIGSFVPFDSIIYGDFNSLFVPFGFRNCIFYLGDSMRFIKGVAKPENPIKDFLKGGGAYHNYFVDVDFGNFSLFLTKDWIEGLGLIIDKKIDIIGIDKGHIGTAGASLEFIFRENMWVRFNFIALLILIFGGIDLGLPLFEVLTEKGKYPSGDIIVSAKDASPLDMFASTEVPLVEFIGSKILQNVSKKGIIIK